MNPAVSVQEILTAVSALNGAALPDKARQDLLDIYRRYVNQIFEDFDSPLFRQVLRRTKDREQISRAVGGLTSELARNYKLIVLHSHEKGHSAKRARFRRAIYCAVEHTVFGLVHAVRTCRPMPHGAYRNLHELYRLADDQKVLDHPVSFPDAHAPSGTVAALYKQFLLFSICDPYHLGRGEVLPLFRFLERYMTRARLRRDDDCNKPQQNFVLDLGGDAPPIPCGLVNEWRSLRDPVILDTSDVTSAAVRDQSSMAATQTQEPDAERRRRLLGHLVPRLEGTRLRKDPRKPTHRTLRLVLGLDSVHRMLMAEGQRLAQAAADRNDLAVAIAAPPSQAAIVLSTWQVTNEGPGGLGLQGPLMALGDSQAGDLVAILEPDAGHARSDLAIIRWARADETAQLSVGVERLNTTAVPVDCRVLHEWAQGTDAVPALLLSGTADGTIPATLLARKGIYAEGENLILIRAGRTIPVRMGERIMDTAVFERFRYEQVKD